MASDPRDYRVELSGGGGGTGGGARPVPARPFLGVRFDCCGVYARAYRDAAGSAYRGRCPRCGRAVTFRVGHGGTDARFFVVS